MNSEQPKPTDPTTKPLAGNVHKVHPRSKVSLAVVIIVVIACVGGAIYYSHHKNSKNSSSTNTPSAATIKANETKGLYTFIYSGKLEVYSVPGPAAGQGLSFSKPIEFAPLNGGSITGQVQLFQNINKAGSVIPFGQIAAASSPAAITPAYTAALTATFAKSSNPGYDATLKPLEDFVQARVGTSYKLTYQAAKAFTGTNIKSNAWAVGFSGASQTTTNMIQPNIQGEAVLAAGNNGFYYFMISAPTSNWTNNQSLWTKVFNSLKIDQ